MYTNFFIKYLKQRGISGPQTNYTCRTSSHIDHQPPLGDSMVGNTTILSLGHSDEVPKVLLGELEGKTDRTPLNTELKSFM